MSTELKNKIYNYEVSPPPRAWSAIAASLDGEIYGEFPQKLSAYEVTPPAGAWDKIAASLDGEREIPVVPLSRNRTPIWRYAAAAALIGLVALSLFWINSGTAISEPVATGTTPLPSTRSNNLPTPENNHPSITADENDDMDMEIIPAEETRSYAAANNYRNTYRPQASFAGGRDALINQPVQLAYSFSVDNMNGNLQPRNAVNRQDNRSEYVTLITNDGHPVRISRKLADMIGCLYNEPTLNNSDCQETIKKWRAKIAEAPITPTPYNFLDMVDLINSIQENNP